MSVRAAEYAPISASIVVSPVPITTASPSARLNWSLIQLASNGVGAMSIPGIVIVPFNCTIVVAPGEKRGIPLFQT